ncbi:hypothetical protein HD806DRAFT_529321 [Xylariaceae sp. AK1471]|nr:hypothetical protein HD806DRAFT_529321 [Xylariaceae sp. AK1471]
MPKWDKTRNYYADLELPSSASSDEIKRQFKKLALKYHPDRNPGREAEVNPKFQVIQSAHEILTDDTLKRQYDEARRSYRAPYPSASGVRGNPWQDAGKGFPPPPRRTAAQTRPASGAQRYESFASSMPGHRRPQTPKDDPQFRRSNAEAWDNIRPSSTRKSTQVPPATPGRAPPGRAPTSATRDARPGPIPSQPRTAHQKQKAQAAFGTSKKTGFTPRSPGVADEPPVSNKNYFTTRTHSHIFTDAAPDDAIPQEPSHNATTSAAADPLAQFREKFMDNRQSTPYYTPGGEKTSLFDSNPGLGRSASTRTPPRAHEMPGAFPRARTRSVSSAQSSSNDGGSEDSTKVNTGIGGATNRYSTTTQSRASERYKPKPAAAATSIPTHPANTTQASMPSAAAAQSNGSGPSVYASQTHPTQFRSQFIPATSRPDRARDHATRARDWLSLITGYHLPDPSSEETNSREYTTLLPLEVHQRTTLDRLVSKYSMADKNGGGIGNKENGNPQHSSTAFATNNREVDANGNRASSFTFPAGSNTATKAAGSSPFTRHSTENINTKFAEDATWGFNTDFGSLNETTAPSKPQPQPRKRPTTENIDTRFVEDDKLDDWEFKAGSFSANEATTPSRPRPRSRPTRRQTPSTKPTSTTRMPPVQDGADDTNTDEHGFSAGKWNEQIGPQHFEPQPTNSASTSPTRRGNLKKTKSFKMTAGTAAVVDDESSEGLQDVPNPPRSATPMADAMDIDSPPPEPKPLKVNSARKYSTEPNRADWRAGVVNDVSSKTAGPTSSTNGTKVIFPETNVAQPTLGTTNQFPSQQGGSEDTEEFRTTFSDFKKVEPFTEPLSTGLGSFADLKTTLPFQSRPSEQIPADIKPRAKSLEFPTVPVAPRLPPTMAVAGVRPNTSSFRKYAQDFNNYLEKWEVFNNKVVAHFATRQEEFKLRRSRRGANWLEDGVVDYLAELDQDLDVQKKYADACMDHRRRVAEFMEFRDRVK